MALRLASRFRDLGHDVDVVALDEPTGDRLESVEQIQVVRAPPWAVGQRLRRSVGLRRHLAAHPYDIIHAQTFIPNIYARCAVAASRHRARVVTTLQSASDDHTRFDVRLTERALGRWTDAVVAVSPRLATAYSDWFPTLASRVCVIPNAMDAAQKPRVFAVDRPVTFAVVGRLTRFKNVETAIRGFAAFKRDHPTGDHILRIVGPDSDEIYAAELRALAKELGGSIQFDGAVPDPFDHLPIDVLIHASYREGHPLTLLEAAAHRIPIVCGDVEEIRDAVGGHCTTFSPSEPQELAAALATVVEDWPASLLQASAASAAVPAIEEAAEMYLQLFKGLLGARLLEAIRA